MPDIEYLDAEISEDEVRKALRGLKSGKASGPDDISAEMLKTAEDVIIEFLVKLFNTLFMNGIYPEGWKEAIIVPVYKKGDKDSPNNYRGISLLSLIGKCYVSVLNARLYSWAENNRKISETQAGFRKGYRTTDHIFALYAATQKYLSQPAKLYTCFVDLRRAFDTVKHATLFRALFRTGVSKRFCKAVMAMYDSLKASVRVKNDVTDSFQCPQGLRQGCGASPTFFSLVINEISEKMARDGKHGVQFCSGLLELFILLFADDLVLLSSTPVGLQNQLNCLTQVCASIGLEINKDKTKVMVFRKGGFLGRAEKWYIGGQQLEVVNSYVYLGFTFTTTMSFTSSANQLAVKGKRAAVDIVRALRQIDNMSRQTFFKLFDTIVQPTLLYAAEVWGLLQSNSSVETVHLYACKKFLSVPVRTPTEMVYGELGRYPLRVNCFVKILQYWFRLIKMDISRIPKQAYMMLVRLDEQGKMNWVTTTRSLLGFMGFYFVWINKGVGDEKKFLSVFKQRAFDIACQDWIEGMRNSNCYEQYRSYKMFLVPERYFADIQIKGFRDALVRFRLGVSDIATHRNRFIRNPAPGTNDCKFCPGQTENERHVLFHCSAYNDIRPLPLQIEGDQETNVFLMLMSAIEPQLTKQLAWFLFKCSRIRQGHV